MPLARASVSAEGQKHSGSLDPESTLSPKELAAVIGLSESTLKRWVDSGVVNASKTPGGHRRIPRAEAIRLIRESNLPVLHPDALGIPELSLARETATPPGLEGLRLFEMLREGQERHVRALLISLYLSGRSMIEICDGPVREAMHRIGELWQHSDSGIYLEHRASDIMIGALNHLRSVNPPPPADAPFAIGGAPSGDPYIIPSLTAAIVLESNGFRTQNLGPDLPLASLATAAEQLKPLVVWLSLSGMAPPPGTVGDVEVLAGRLSELGVALVVGGRNRGLAPQHPGVHLAMSMGELVAFARGVAAKR